MIANSEALRGAYMNVWVVAEVQNGEIQRLTHELLGAGRALADTRKVELWCVVLGTGLSAACQELIYGGADVVLVVDDVRLAGFLDEDESAVLARLIRRYRPEILLCGATTRGRALIPRVAVATDCGLTADCTALSIDPVSGDLLQTRPAFGGNIMATIRCSDHRPQMATVRPRVMTALAPDFSRTGRIITETLQDGEHSGLKKVVQVFRDTEHAINLADARFIISGGRGVRGPEGFRLLRALADRVNGAVGASRAAVDSGWVPYSQQVGQTGQTVQAKVYVACGISGQIQHLVGMQSCDYIIAIDRKPDTPMMRMADVAIVGDLFEVLPAIVSEIPKT